MAGKYEDKVTMSLAYCILRTSYKSRELAVLGATIVGGSSGHRETPSIAIVLYDCHVSTNRRLSPHKCPI